MRDDLRNAIRSLRQSGGFTAVALTVLALGIGSATAIFSVVDAVVLRGLPFDEHDRLVAVYDKDTKRAVTFGEGSITPQTYLDWRQLQQPFEHLAAAAGTRFNLKSETGEPADARAYRVSWELFPVLRLSPALGRAFTADDEIEGRHQKVILSYGFWQRRYGGSPDAIGQTIELGDDAYEIVGVMPRGFLYPVGADRPSELFVPLMFRQEDRTKGGSHNYNYAAIGRLRPGVTLAQAQDQMERLSAQLDEQNPKWAPGRRARVVPLQEFLVGKVRSWMLMLLGAVALVLLIACANVANLMLARATVRTREMGVRAALGASPWRLVRGLLVEGLVLALSGAALGLLLAAGFVNVLRTWLPANVPKVAAISLDWRVVGFAVGAAVLTGVFFGIVPALHSARPDLTNTLKDGGRSSTAGVAGQRLRNLLVVAEVALAVILVVGAGLFTGSFVRLMKVNPGFDYHNVIVLNIGVHWKPGQKFDDEFAAANRRLADQAREEVAKVPGILGVAEISGGLPLTGSWSRNSFEIIGRGEMKDDDSIDTRSVTPEYLAMMRIPLKRGRYLAATDGEQAPLVAVVNETAARKYWPGADPIGQRIKINKQEREIVGVVGDVHHLGPEIAPRQELYLPMAQTRNFGVTLVARAAGNAMAVLPAVKSAIWHVDREQRLTGDTLTLDGYMDRLIAQRRFNMAVLALFGLLGLLIAAVGIYGVMAYVVAQRTSEIGVRMALGATRGRVVSMVLGRASVLMAIGLAIGGAVSWYFSAGVRAFLFDVQPNDGGIFALALGTLAVAGLVASVVPARRAAGVDPLIALRSE
jgi:putative ABC transport system permease protein